MFFCIFSANRVRFCRLIIEKNLPRWNALGCGNIIFIGITRKVIISTRAFIRVFILRVTFIFVFTFLSLWQVFSHRLFCLCLQPWIVADCKTVGFFFSKSVKKSVKRTAFLRLSPVSLSVFRLVSDLLFDCSRLLKYAKIQTVLQSRIVGMFRSKQELRVSPRRRL